MLEALERIGNRTVTAKQVQTNGVVLKRLAEMGLLLADMDTVPPTYRIGPLGRAAVALLTAEVRPVPSEQPIARIQRETAEYFRIPLIEMTSDRRSRQIARPRQIAMYLAREMTPLSLPAIGRCFGGRDHTTIMHGCAVIEALVEKQGPTRAAVCELRRLLTGDRSGGIDYDDQTEAERVMNAKHGSAALRNAIMALAA
jgi:hypothetical protein